MLNSVQYTIRLNKKHSNEKKEKGRHTLCELIEPAVDVDDAECALLKRLNLSGALEENAHRLADVALLEVLEHLRSARPKQLSRIAIHRTS